MLVLCPSCQAIIEAPVGPSRQVQCPICSGIMALPEAPEELPIAALVTPAHAPREKKPTRRPEAAVPRPARRRSKLKNRSQGVGLVVPVIVGAVILIALAVILSLVFSNAGDKGGQARRPEVLRPQGGAGGQAGGAPMGAPGQEMAPQEIYIQLTDGEVFQGMGGLNFSVKFTVVRPVPAHEQYSLIIRSSRGTIYEARLMLMDLRESGTLAASSVGAFTEGLTATFTCWIETLRGLGFGGGKRISNEIQLRTGGRGGMPGIPPPPGFPH